MNTDVLFMVKGSSIEVICGWVVSGHCIEKDGRTEDERIWRAIIASPYFNRVFVEVRSSETTWCSIAEETILTNLHARIASYQSELLIRLLQSLPMMSKAILEYIIAPYCAPVGSLKSANTTWSDTARLMKAESEDGTVLYKRTGYLTARMDLHGITYHSTNIA